MKQYRATIVYYRTRPYHPEAEKSVSDPATPSHFVDWYKNDLDSVGKIERYVVGPYKTKGTVKAQIKKTLVEYPFANIYGDGKDGYTIVQIDWEEAEPVIQWKEIDAP